MKKIYLSIGTLLLCGNLLMAQSPANRTAKTVAADVLAQMPVQQQAEYNKMMNDLTSAGEEAVSMLIDMINAPGKGSNSKVDYALSGLTHYVIAAGNEDSRLAIANAYLKALDKVSERETKAFIIRQLQLMGKDECIDALTSYLNDENLSGPAARALASIGSENSAKALSASLLRRSGTPKTQKDIILAIADIQAQGTEEALRAMLGSGDENMQKEVLYALSRVGSKASLKDLADAAAKAGYTMEKTGANEAYVTLIKRVAEQGDVKDAEKAANDLLKKATKVGKIQSRDAAMQILMSLKKDNVTKLLLTALKDQCKEYRNAALNYASDYADKNMYIELVKTMSKAKPAVKVDILNWLGRESKCPTKHDIIKGLELRFDLTAMQVLLQQLNDSNFDVKQAATWALVRIGDEQAISALANLLTSQDKQVVLLGQDALAAFSGDVAPLVAKVMPVRLQVWNCWQCVRLPLTLIVYLNRLNRGQQK